MKQIFILSLTITILLTTACRNNTAISVGKDNTSNFDTTALRKMIEEKNKQFARAHVLRDTAFLNNIFTQNARVLAPNSEMISGRSAIAAINLAYVNYGIDEAHIETTKLYGSGDYLINEGNYMMRYGKGSTVDKGKFIYIWKKVGSDWKLDSDIWNSSTPANQAK
ncbi:MAG: nuclear transport factor 2 family protein [Bacteroidetes bacterium]|nr:nuclear transport factor 2 family protein [Bacteroidota bacterium]MBS1539661.1 nuclear transport factor 2 family protein [Bacteroidota bacterium]